MNINWKNRRKSLNNLESTVSVKATSNSPFLEDVEKQSLQFFKKLAEDSVQRRLLLDLLSKNEEDSVGNVQLREKSVTPKKLQKKFRLESPSALWRRKALEREKNKENDDTLPSSSQNKNTSQCSPFDELLKGVVAYVELKCNGEDKSSGAKKLMKAMGAEVRDTFTKDVTHVVFKDGSYNTYYKAKLLKIHLVSVLWLDAIQTTRIRVPEKKFPALGYKRHDQDLSKICLDFQKDYEDMIQDEFQKNLAISTEILSQSLNSEELRNNKKRRSYSSSSNEDYSIPHKKITLRKPNKKESTKMCKKLQYSPHSDQFSSSGSFSDVGSDCGLIDGYVSKKDKELLILNQTVNESNLEVDNSVEIDARVSDSFEKSLLKENQMINSRESEKSVAAGKKSTSSNESKSLLTGKSAKTLDKSKCTVSSKSSFSTDEIHLKISTNSSRKRSSCSTNIESNEKSTDTSNAMSSLRVSTSTVDSRNNDNLKSTEKELNSKKEHENFSKKLIEENLDKEKNSSKKRKLSNLKSVDQVEESTHLKSIENRINSKADTRTSENFKKSNRDPKSSDLIKNKILSTVEGTINRKSINFENKNKQTPHISKKNQNLADEEVNLEENIQSNQEKNSISKSNSDLSKIDNHKENFEKVAMNNDLTAAPQTVRKSTRISIKNKQHNLLETYVNLELMNIDIVEKKFKERVTKMRTPKKRLITENEPTDKITNNTSPSKENKMKKMRRLYNPDDFTLEKENSDNELLQRKQKILNISRAKKIPKVLFNTSTTTTNISKNKFNNSYDVDSPKRMWKEKKNNDNNTERKSLSSDDNISENKKNGEVDKNLVNIEKALFVRRTTRLRNKKLTQGNKNKLESEESSQNRRSSHDFVKQKKTVFSQKKAKKTKSESIVCTRLHRPEVQTFIQIVKKLGTFFVEDEVSEKTTHLVAGDPSRTINMLKAIARGCWVLKIEWLYKSLEAGQWIDEEDYELTEFSSAVQLCRKQRQAFGSLYCMDIFENMGPIFVSMASTPRRSDLQELIILCRGKISKNARTASVVVGEYLDYDDVICVSEKWVLDSITFNKKKPFRSYKLTNPRS